jgi:hypothetical protein
MSLGQRVRRREVELAVVGAQPEIAARIVVLLGDGLLREAFRLDPEGDPIVLDEGRHALAAYVATRLG